MRVGENVAMLSRLSHELVSWPRQTMTTIQRRVTQKSKILVANQHQKTCKAACMVSIEGSAESEGQSWSRRRQRVCRQFQGVIIVPTWCLSVCQHVEHRSSQSKPWLCYCVYLRLQMSQVPVNFNVVIEFWKLFNCYDYSMIQKLYQCRYNQIISHCYLYCCCLSH